MSGDVCVLVKLSVFLLQKLHFHFNCIMYILYSSNERVKANTPSVHLTS